MKIGNDIFYISEERHHKRNLLKVYHYGDMYD